MESSARFLEIDATDLLEMRENNQNKNIQRSRKTRITVVDLWIQWFFSVLLALPQTVEFLRGWTERRVPHSCIQVVKW